MRPLILTLSGLLACQLFLAFLLNSSPSKIVEQSSKEALLSFEVDSVSQLDIQDGESGQSILLARAGDKERWVLPLAGDFPANGRKVQAFLNRLNTVERGSLIATSENAAKRFHVSEDNFERKLSLQGVEGIIATLYLGSSQGARQVHARRAEEAGISHTSLSFWSVSADPDRWIDATVLQIPQADVIGVNWGSVWIERARAHAEKKEEKSSEDESQVALAEKVDEDLNEEKGGDEEGSANNQSLWLLRGDLDQTLPEAVVEKLLDRISALLVSGLVSPDAHGEYDHKNPLLVLKIQLKDGGERVYTLFKGSGHAGYALAASHLSWWVKIPGITAERLLESVADPLFISASGTQEGESKEHGSEAGSVLESGERRAEKKDPASEKSGSQLPRKGETQGR